MDAKYRNTLVYADSFYFKWQNDESEIFILIDINFMYA